MTQKKGRFFLDKSNPRVWRALNSFGHAANEAAAEAGIDRGLLELMFVRISQLNGCVYCLDLHSREAVAAGIPQELLAFLPAWRDTRAFTDVERALLTIGEAATELPDVETRKENLAWAREILGDAAFGAAAMNAYNRVSILSEHPAKNPRP